MTNYGSFRPERIRAVNNVAQYRYGRIPYVNRSAYRSYFRPANRPIYYPNYYPVVYNAALPALPYYPYDNINYANRPYGPYRYPVVSQYDYDPYYPDLAIYDY